MYSIDSHSTPLMEGDPEDHLVKSVHSINLLLPQPISIVSKYICFCIPVHWVVLPPDGETRVIDNSAMSTTFLLLNSMIGSGILVQAYVFKETGLILATFEYIAIGCMIYAGVDLTTRCADQIQVFDYSRMATHYLGRRGGLVVDYSFVINNIGGIISYILIVGSLIKSVIRTFSSAHGWYTHIGFLTVAPIVTFTVPCCLIRHYGDLAIISYISLVAISGSIFLVVIGGPLHRAQSDNDEQPNLASFVGSIRTIGSIVFALGYITAIFQSYTALKDKTVSKFSTITRHTTLLGTAMCFVIGLVGYLSFGSDTKSNVLENFDTPVGAVFKVVVALHLILYIPGDFVILREALWKICGADVTTQSDALFVSLTLALITCITAVAVVLQIYCGSSDSLAIVMDVTGGIAGSVLYFIMPAALGLRVFGADEQHRELYYRCIGLLVFGTYIIITVALSYFL
jgi:sodium-coupled neutral amino acid transporter 11